MCYRSVGTLTGGALGLNVARLVALSSLSFRAVDFCRFMGISDVPAQLAMCVCFPYIYEVASTKVNTKNVSCECDRLSG